MKKRIPCLKKGCPFGLIIILMLSTGVGGFLAAQEIADQSFPSIVATLPFSHPDSINAIV